MLYSLAYLGFQDIREIEKMTLPEYELRMEAHLLKQAETNSSIHKLAFLNQVAKSTKGGKSPKPVYPTFDSFYDLEKEKTNIRKSFEPNYKVQKVGKEAKKEKQLEIIMKRQKEYNDYLKNRKE